MENKTYRAEIWSGDSYEIWEGRDIVSKDGMLPEFEKIALIEKIKSPKEHIHELDGKVANIESDEEGLIEYGVRILSLEREVQELRDQNEKILLIMEKLIDKKDGK